MELLHLRQAERPDARDHRLLVGTILVVDALILFGLLNLAERGNLGVQSTQPETSSPS